MVPVELTRRAALLVVLAALVPAGSCGGGGDGSPGTRRPTAANRSAVGPARTVTRTCASRVEGGRLEPDPATDIRVGPIIFYGLRSAADRAPGEFTTTDKGISEAWKTVTEVTASTRATLTVRRADRDQLALIYGNFISGRRPGYRLSEGSSAVRFEACPADEPRFSGRGAVGARTQFNGGFIVAKPGCYQVAARVVGSKRTFRHAIGFGSSRHRCAPTYVSKHAQLLPVELKQFRRHVDFCFTAENLQTSAGEAFAGATQPGSGGVSRRATIIRRSVNGAFIPTERAQIRLAGKYAPRGEREHVARIADAMVRGINEVRANPELLVKGRIPGFQEARRLAERYELHYCPPGFR